MPADSDALADGLRELLHDVGERAPIKHALMSVYSGGGFQWTASIGEYPDGTPIPHDAPFFIASIDKLFNATLAMTLVEAGVLKLSDPLALYLGSDLIRGLHRMHGSDFSAEITISHLLGHTSGLADWLEDRPRGGRALVERVLEEGDLLVDFAGVAAIVRELPPHFAPQDFSRAPQRARYSDTNYMLLCAAIEAATGQALHEVHERLILGPLGLCHTWFAGRSHPAASAPAPVPLTVNGRKLEAPSFLKSVWGMYSTMSDLVAFLRCLIRGELFERPDTFAAMQRWNRFGLPLDRAALRAPGWPIEYGFGIMRFRLPRLLTLLHPMPAVVGHTGSTGCWLFHAPQADVLLAGTVNEVTAGALPYRIVPRMLRLLATGGGQ